MAIISYTARLAAVATLSTLLVSPAMAQTASIRVTMERCVDGVLSRMARSKASEAQAGQAVISQCDGPLRAVLASAIKTGDAPICSVESCIGMARERAAEEARSAYRERIGR